VASGADSDSLATAFEANRDRLRAIAYRLLGSVADADDAVQDTWLRLTSTDAGEVVNLGGWLTTVVARVSLNMLRSRRHRQEEPVGDRWPASAEAAGRARGTPGSAASGATPAGDPEDEAMLADSVGLALLVVLDTLTPAERLAFVLHDLFAMSFAEVAAVLDRTPEAARQLASRARRRVRAAPRPDRAEDYGRQRKAASAFLAAARGGELGELVALLDADVTLTGDAFAVPSGRPAELRGADVVSRGAVMSSARAAHSQLALVDGTVGIVYAPSGHLQLVVVPAVNASGKITRLDIIGDPERLQRMRLAVLPD
jgi:RNA polymerase sigma factor (sigma-70 family)